MEGGRKGKKTMRSGRTNEEKVNGNMRVRKWEENERKK